MNIKEIKREALKNLKTAAEQRWDFFALYLGIVVFTWIIAFNIDILSFGWLIFMVSFYYIGKIDLEKAYLFLKLSGKDKTNCSNFSDLGDRLPHNSFNNIIFCYYAKYYFTAIFFVGSCIMPEALIVSYVKYYITSNHLYAVSSSDAAESILIAAVSFCMFLFLLIKYFFTEYIVAEKVSELLETGGSFKGDTLCRYDSKTLIDGPGLRTIISDENKNLVGQNLFEIIKLTLSFSGWFLLSLLTLGLGFVFTIPYFNSASAYFYTQLRAHNARIGDEVF